MERLEHPARPSLIAVSALFVLAAGMVLGQSSRGGAQVRESTRLLLVAALDNTTAKKGTPVFINLSLKNIDIDPVWLQSGCAEYDITVTDASGRRAQLTEYGLAFLVEMSCPKFTPALLLPGQEERATLELTKLYMLPAGRYRVEAFRRLIFPAPYEATTPEEERTFYSGVRASSNQVELTIVE
jgi:hypothetical protein